MSSTRFNLSQTTRPNTPMRVGERPFVDVLASPRFADGCLQEPTIVAAAEPTGRSPSSSYNFWQSRFDGTPDVIGRTLTIERVTYTVIGVTPPGFFGVDVGRTFDIAIPLGTEPLVRGKESSLDRRSNWWLSVMVRLKAGQSIDAAAGALRGVQPQIREATSPQNFREEDKIQYLNEAFVLTPAATGNSTLRDRIRKLS